MTQENNSIKSSMGTKLAFGVGDVGFACTWAFVGSFIMMYYTDSVGLSAAFTGTMLLLCRLLDGASDFVMGAVIEKTHTRLGKCRPWLLASIIPFCASFILLFSIPSDLSQTGKQIYAYATYIFMAVICYTMSNLAYNSLLSRFSTDADDTVTASIVRVLISIVATMVVNMASLNILDAFGGTSNPAAWKKISIVFALICFVCQGITGIFVKERQMTEQQTKVYEKKHLGTLYMKVLTNKYFWLTLAENLLISCGFIGINVYYARDVLGNENLVGAMSIGLMGTVLLTQPILPKAVKCFGKRKVMMAGGLFFLISGLIIQFISYNAVAVIAAYFIRGMGQSIYMGLIMTLAADLVAYIKQKEGAETEGICYATCSIGGKVGAGLGLGLVGWTLQWGHYDASLSVQAAGTLQAMINLNGLGYALVGGFMFIGMYFLKYDN